MFDVFYIGKKPNLFAHEKAVNTIQEAQSMSTTRYCWVVNYLVDYTGFDFLWEPCPWEQDHLHVWPSQWQKNSGTYLVPKQEFGHTNYNHESLKRLDLANIAVIDHGNIDTATIHGFKKTRYVENYLKTLRRIIHSSEEDFLWVCSSVCDYSNFDFSWHPSEWQSDMIHVFASDEQKFGDTFFINVGAAKKYIDDSEMLDWLSINFVPQISVPRIKMPVVAHDNDSHMQVIQDYKFNGPLALFTNNNITIDYPCVSLWRPETKTIVALSKGASQVIVPREAQLKIEKQFYDYPYISRNHMYGKDSVLPIIFVSNGEPCADSNWQHLCEILGPENTRLHRIDKVQGRVNSQLAAARIANSPWYIVVPAKLKVSEYFDWSWQPDRMQLPKHYIFHAHNPVTGLTYGHMAAVCYNRSLVEQTKGQTLDFTMEVAHTVVNELSGESTYNCDAKTAWRTAFREVLKLQYFLSLNSDIETEFRLEQWLASEHGVNAEYSNLGAHAAVDYYKTVNGDFNKLRLTYEWQFVDHLFEQSAGHFNLK